MKILRTLIAACTFAAIAGAAEAKLNVVTTLQDLASIAHGGRRRPRRRLRPRQGLPGPALRRRQAVVRAAALARRPADRRRARARDRLPAAARRPEPQRARSSPARRATSTPRWAARSCGRRPARSRAPWATSTPTATRTTGPIPRTAASSRARSRARLSQLDPAGSRRLRRRTWPPSKRASTPRRRSGRRSWQPYDGLAGRHLPRLLAQLRQALRPRGGGPHRAQAGDSAVARAHARDHQPDPGEEGAADPRRALLRQQDAEVHRRQDRRRRCSSSTRRWAARRRSRTTSRSSTPTSTALVAALRRAAR